MKIGLIPPMPVEPFSASTHEAVNLWSHFFLAQDREPWLETARLAGFPKDYSVWARCLYGLCCDLGVETVYYPQPGLPKELALVFRLLEEQGIRAVPFHFPILRNEQRLHDELAHLVADLGVEEGIMDVVFGKWAQTRTALRRFDGLQQNMAGFTSRQYVSLLARGMEPRRDVDTLKKDLEAGILGYQEAGRGRWLRLGLLGLTPYRTDFYEALEGLRSVVVYDEWGIENNPMGTGPDMASLYHECSLFYGLKRRGERCLREIAARRIRGIVLSVEYICESIRDEGFFRANMGVPVFVLENSAGGPLSPAEMVALERFVAECGRS